MYIAPGQGQTAPRGQNFEFLSLHSFVASFKKISLKSDFIHFFYDFIHVFFHDFIHAYSPGAGSDSPQGQSFDVNRNVLSLHSFVASVKKCLWRMILYSFFHELIHVYSPRAGADSPQGTKFWFLVTSFICCKFKKKSLWSLILYNFFHDFIHVYSPKAGADNPQGTKFWCQQKGLITLPICCKFQWNLFEVWF